MMAFIEQEAKEKVDEIDAKVILERGWKENAQELRTRNRCMYEFILVSSRTINNKLRYHTIFIGRFSGL